MLNSHKKRQKNWYCVFHKEKLDQIDTVYRKHIYHSQDQLGCGILTWVEFERTGRISLTNKYVNCTTKEHFLTGNIYQV